MTVIVLSNRCLEETIITESCIPRHRSCDLVGDTDGHCANGWDSYFARKRNRNGIRSGARETLERETRHDHTVTRNH